MNIGKPLLLLIFMFIMQTLFAQNEDIRFTHFSPKNGLSTNSINSILQDSFGLIWLATQDGLNRFDGYSFKIFRHMPADTSGLPSNNIKALHEDKEGNLWVGSDGGPLCIYDRKKNQFVRVRAKKNSQTPMDVRSIYSDRFGKVWVGTYTGLYVLDGSTHEILKFPTEAKGPGSLPAIVINNVFEDSKSRIWVGTINGLYLFNRKTASFVKFINTPSDSSSLAGKAVKAITEDKDGNLWIGTLNGLSRLRSDNKSFKNYRHSENGSGSLSSNVITSIAADQNGKLWVGTDDGLNIFDVKTGISTVLKPDQRNVYSLTGRSIDCVYIDKQGINWVAVYRGGLCKYDKSLNLFGLKQTRIFDENGLSESVVSSFAEDKKGNIFIGTDGGTLNVFNKKTELFQHFDIKPQNGKNSDGIAILSMERTRGNKLYIGSFSDGLFIVNPETKSVQQIQQGERTDELNSNDIFCIKEDKSGFIWLGTNGTGINVIGPDNKVAIKFCQNPIRENEYMYPLNDYVRVFEEDKEGNMWIGSLGRGIAVYNPLNKKFRLYNRYNSNLPNDIIVSILSDSKNNIWVATASGGISILDKKSGKFITFSEKDGLQNNSVFKIIEDKSQLLWLSTTKGISSFDYRNKKFTNYTDLNGVQNNIFVSNSGLITSDGEIFFGGVEGFNYFYPSEFRKNSNVPSVMLTELRVANTLVIPSKNGPIADDISVAKQITLNYGQNISLSFVGVSFTAPRQNQYAYKLQGFDKDWVYAGTSRTASYTNLDPGEYEFYVRASNNNGVWSIKTASIKIIIKPPIWRTPLAYTLYIIILVVFILYSRRLVMKRLKKEFALKQERKDAEQLRALDALKIKFLTNLSHEFRTPVSLISGPVDQLLSQETDTRKQEQLQLVKRNIRRLLNLVNQLLDFRKMEEHELTLNLAEDEIVSFIRELTYSFKDISRTKNVELRFFSTIESFNTVFDPEKTERILFNLLSNAFKFTHRGDEITVKVTELEKSNEPELKWIVITVTDTGIGIPKDKLEKIFDRFFQHDTGASVLNQGTGIGLSICHEFVKMQGGTVDVESEVGSGTSFRITLPFKLIEATVQPVEEIHEPVLVDEVAIEAQVISTDGSLPEEAEGVPALSEAPKSRVQEKQSILIVEDDDDFRSYLKNNLKDYYTVFEASDGKEGWQRALAHHPEIVISDVSMPYMDGIALVRKLKGDKRTSHIPTILLTALTTNADQMQGLESGANDYVTKPFNFEILNAKVKNLLNLNNTLKSAYSKHIKVSPTDIKVESDDEKLLNQVMLYLEENLTTPKLSVEELSKHVGMSRSNLYHRLLKITGLTPIEFINFVKLDKAAALMEKTDMNIAQIAYATGFSSPNYFGQSFKARFNVLPSEYINQKRKNKK